MRFSFKKVLVVIILITAFSFIAKAAVLKTAESCFVNLSIKESKVNNKIVFTFDKLENLYGIYQGAVTSYNAEFPRDYILKTYDLKNKVLGQYGVNSSRFIYYDTIDPENPGGIIEQDQGTISTIIPYNKNIKKIKIVNNNIETDLAVPVSSFSCQRTCKIKGETGNYENQNCCQGHFPATKEDGAFVCLQCGDNVCSPYETYYSCPTDCYTPEIMIAEWQDSSITLDLLMSKIKSYYKI